MTLRGAQVERLFRFCRGAALLLPMLLVLIPFSNADSAPEQKARVHTVKIKGMAYEPATLEVAVGDTVLWVNEDLVPHTATSVVDGKKVFDSGEFPPKASWKWVAAKAGTFPYVCLLHPTMKGTVIVR